MNVLAVVSHEEAFVDPGEGASAHVCSKANKRPGRGVGLLSGRTSVGLPDVAWVGSLPSPCLWDCCKLPYLVMGVIIDS